MRHNLKSSNFIIIAAVAMATLLVIVSAGESTARFAMSQHISERCDAHPAAGFKRNCVEEMKLAEGPAVTMRFNDCGSRSTQSCFDKPRGMERIVVLGTSIARGFGVRQEDMYSAKVEALLEGRCRHPVEVQNLSITWPGPQSDPSWKTLAESFSEAQRLRPNAMILFVASYDLHTYEPGAQEPRQPVRQQRGLRALVAGVAHAVSDKREQSRAILALRHLLFQDRRVLLERALQDRDGTDYMRAPLSVAWQARLQMLDEVAGSLEAAARRSGVPGILVYTPYEAQVVAARQKDGISGLDPYQLPAAIRGIAVRHGLGYIDTLPAFIQRPVTQTNFYLVNSHPNAAGHAVIGEAIAKNLWPNDCTRAGA